MGTDLSDQLVDLEHDGEAAEIILGRPPRFVRFSIYLFATLLLVAVFWAYFSRVDIYITATGVVRPEGDLVKVQSVVGGQLLEVNVKEGDLVKKGDLLFRIDGKEAQTELEKSIGRLEARGKQLASLRASRKNLVQQQLAEGEKDQINIATAAGEVEKAKSSRRRMEASLLEAEARLDGVRNDYERTKRLVEDGISSKAELQGKETALKETEAAKEGATASLRIAEKEFSLSQQNLSLWGKQAEISSEQRERALADLDGKLVALEEEGHSLALEIENLRSALDHLQVRAPVSGVITVVANKNAGEVIQPGAMVATMAPEGVPWVIEALVSNQDAGPLRQKIGSPVKIKFHAFPFRDYGTGEGKLLEVLPDAIPDEALGMVYRIRIGMDSLVLRRGRREGRIELGMTVTAEIFREEERMLLLLFRGVRDRVSYEE